MIINSGGMPKKSVFIKYYFFYIFSPGFAAYFRMSEKGQYALHGHAILLKNNLTIIFSSCRLIPANFLSHTDHMTVEPLDTGYIFLGL